MDDAAQRRQLRVHARQHRVERGDVPHVGQFDLDPDASPAQRLDGLPSLGVGIPAAVQHDGPGAPVRQPFGHGAADSPQATGDQVGAILSQPAPGEGIGRHHDLPQVPGRPHEPQRWPGLGQRPPAVDERLQHARRELVHHLSQYLAHPLRLGLLEHVQLQDVVAHVRAHRRHLLVGQDVPPGQLDEATTLGQARQAGLDEALAGEAVQQHVNALASGGLQDLVAERGLTAVVYVLHAQRPYEVVLRKAGRGEHLRTRGVRQLDGGRSYPARPGVDQDPFPGLQSRVVEREGGRHEGAGNGGQGGGGHPFGRRRHQLLVGDHLGGEGAEPEPHHVIADADIGDVGAGVDHVAAQFPAQIPFLDEAERAEDIPEVETGGLDRHPDLPGLQGARRQHFDLRSVEHAVPVRLQHPVRLLGQRQPPGYGVRSRQAGRQAASRAVGDVVLVVGIHQLVHEAGHRVRAAGVQVDHARLQVRRLQGHHLAHTPQDRAGQLPEPFPLEHLRPSGDEPHAVGRRRIRIGHALDQGQRARSGLPHVLRHLGGGCLRPAPSEALQVDDPVEGHVRGQVLDERSPRLPGLRIQALPDDRAPDGRLVAPRQPAARQDDRLVPRRQLARELLSSAVAAGGHDPGSGRLVHLLRALRHDHALVQHLEREGVVDPQDLYPLEAGVSEGAAPHGRGGQGVVGAVVLVGEPPPAVQLAEGEVHPAQAAQVLERHQLARRSEKGPAMAQRLLEETRSVQDVGGDDQVVAVGGEALGDGVLLDVQRPVLDAPVSVAEPFLRLGEEPCRDVRVGVVEASGGKLRQYRRGGRSGARPHLDHPQPSSLREPGQERPDRVPQQGVGGAGHRRLEIEVGRGGFPAAEEERQRIRFTAQRIGQGAAGAAEQPDLGLAVGVQPRHVLGEPLGIGG